MVFWFAFRILHLGTTLAAGDKREQVSNFWSRMHEACHKTLDCDFLAFLTAAEGDMHFHIGSLYEVVPRFSGKQEIRCCKSRARNM